MIDSDDALAGPVQLKHAYLAGAGAIGNGILYALQYFEVIGQLDIVDFDVVKDTNLNRQVWFEDDDIGKYKAEVLAFRAQTHLPKLSLKPRKASLQELPERSQIIGGSRG